MIGQPAQIGDPGVEVVRRVPAVVRRDAEPLGRGRHELHQTGGAARRGGPGVELGLAVHHRPHQLGVDAIAARRVMDERAVGSRRDRVGLEEAELEWRRQDGRRGGGRLFDLVVENAGDAPDREAHAPARGEGQEHVAVPDLERRHLEHLAGSEHHQLGLDREGGAEQEDENENGRGEWAECAVAAALRAAGRRRPGVACHRSSLATLRLAEGCNLDAPGPAPPLPERQPRFQVVKSRGVKNAVKGAPLGSFTAWSPGKHRVVPSSLCRFRHWGGPIVAWMARSSVLYGGHSTSGSRVKPVVQATQPLLVDVGVDLGGRDVRVAEHRLHRAKIGAMRQQVGGEAVAQHVR